jgi:ATP-dependent exoDNAse (exonuclease V) beta subunit
MTSEMIRDADARRAAVDPRRSFIVQAPAGSGKTSLLTLRYLRLLASVNSPEEIVAITFTRKAASEMRHRILDALATATRPLEPGAPPHLQERHALAVAALARSRERGWDLERNTARLHVQTIDGMNHWLAQRLPLAARIGLAANLVDDARPLYREAARRLLDALESGEERSLPLMRLARALDHEPRRLAELLAGMLGTREVWLPKLQAEPDRRRLRAGIDSLLRAALEAELARIRAAVAGAVSPELFAILRAAAVAGGAESPLAPLAPLQGLPETRAEAVPGWISLADLLLTADRQGAVRKTVDRKQGFLAASAGPPWAALKQHMRDELARLAGAAGFEAALCRVRRLPPAALTDGQWERIEALAATLPHAVAELLAVFAERGSLDHAAVAGAARDALQEDDGPTELALALDYRIQHLLVDEYQDTSPSQERLLALLLAGWQDGDGRTLFCVGDPMQSIYAFREADVTLFLQAAEQGVGGVALEALRLERNFRSSRAIVDWVNAGFAVLLPGTDDFERGAVRYSPAEAVHETRAGDGVHVHALIDESERAMGEAVARIVADALLPEAGKARPSIAILVRGRNSLPAIVAALRRAEIDYRGVELESLADRAAMRDLVSLVRCMLHDGDRTAWLSVLRAPWCGLTLEDLHRLAGEDPDASVPSLLGDRERIARLSPDGRTRLLRLREALQPAIAGRSRRTLGGWLKSAWLSLGGPATVEDASDLVNAELLFGAMDRLESESGAWPEVSDIEASVERIRASPVGRDDAPVQVMTIHKAKGLEFDVVIVPDLQRAAPAGDRRLLYWTTLATGPGQRGVVLASRSESAEDDGAPDGLETWMRRLESERADLELGRLAYVAVTRARRILHLVGCARTRLKDGEEQLRRPPPGSLLRFFWPLLEAEFERTRVARGPATVPESAHRPRLTSPPLARLPLDWQPPEPEALPLPPALRILGATDESVRPEFDWAGAVATAVGEVVHLELERLARLGLPRDALAGRSDAWRRLLREAGVDEVHMPDAIVRTQLAIDGFLASDLAGRLLDPAAQEARAELAVTAKIAGSLQSLRIDRSFVDAQGVRWIVDWKTSRHEGGDREAFLDRELERYRSQLERYAEAMRSLEPDRPLRAGLYFPLLDAWREI